MVALSTLITPSSTGATIEAPDGQCMAVAYTVDWYGRHISLVENGTIQFGTSLRIQSDCPGSFDVIIDMSAPTTIPQGGFWFGNVSTLTSTIEIRGEGWGIVWSNLTFWGHSQFAEMMTLYSEQPEPEGEFMLLAELRSHEFIVAAVTVVVAWLVSIAGIDRLAKFFIERRAGVEITEGGQ